MLLQYPDDLLFRKPAALHRLSPPSENRLTSKRGYFWGAGHGAFAELDKLNKGSVSARLKEIKNDPESTEEGKTLKAWLTLFDAENDLKKRIKEAESKLDNAAYDKYPTLTTEEIKTLAVDDKWLTSVQFMIEAEMDRISHSLAERIRVLSERYELRLSDISARVGNLEAKVNRQLERMGFSS